MRYGIFGGGFNPPHMAHVMGAAYAVAQMDLDLLWVSPCWHHPFGKEDELVPWEQRVEMCHLAFAGFLGVVRIPRWEKELQPHYTVDLLEAVLPTLPPGEPYLVVGSDNIQLQEQWRRWPDIVEMLESRGGGLITLGRPGHGTDETKHSPMMPHISSTGIRDGLARGDFEAVENWIPRNVLAYIKKHGLYGVPK